MSEFLKNKRIERGLSQIDVGRQLKFSSSQFISNWERGLSSPPIKVLKKLVKLYKMDAAEVIELILDHERKELKKTLNA